MTVFAQNNTDRARRLLEQLTLDEKLGMIHGAGLFRTEGVKRLGIPPLRMSDGPMGVRREFDNNLWNPLYQTRDFVTYLPCGSAVAATWNKQLARETGEVLGAEARGRGKDMILAPSVNIKRSPLCGRNFEYMSEDPYLTAQQSTAEIEGIQENDVSACVKHFVANSQETDRLHVNESISERALRELYLPAFRAAVEEAQTLGVMGAYNLVNGERCCESTTFLDDILRDEWNFGGAVVSDWGGVFRTRESAECGLDIEMSVTDDFDDYKFANPLKQAIERGEIDEKRVDDKVFHILCVMGALHMLDEDSGHTRKSGEFATSAHRDSALTVAQQSIVLLKNENNLLPLQTRNTKKILVVGANAERMHSNGGGSAEIKALYEITPLLGLCSQLGGNVEVEYAQGYESAEPRAQKPDWQIDSLSDGAARDEQENSEYRRKLREEAVERAKQYQHVLFIGGLNHDYDLEALDRTDMKLPYAQDELIEALLEVNPNTIIALVAGSPVEMPWAEKAKAIVWSWYGGCEAGTALAQTITGVINPSGHLPETFPIRLQDSPAHSIGTFGKSGKVEYSEDIYVGYRYYETQQIPVLFCFGHGLSYTTFALSDLRVSEVDENGIIQVFCTVKNTGDVDGSAVIQVYVGLEEVAEDRPVKELRGYEKVLLQPHESREVELRLSAQNLFGYWSNQTHQYESAGQATLFVGESVQDIRLSQRIFR